MGLEDQIYIATYCNTDVFESVINGIPLMRRYSDDWINATQILRIANFPKNKRTKILEKQVQIHTHEKVQGGYGRFQGTWIPLDIARNLATEYGIDANIAPLLYTDSKELIATPFKRKDKPGRNLGIDNDINPSPTKTSKNSDKKKITKKRSNNDKIIKKLKFQNNDDKLDISIIPKQQQQYQHLPSPLQFMPLKQNQQMQFQQYNFPTQQQQFPPFFASPYNMPQFQPIPNQYPPQLQPPQQHQPSNSQESVLSNVFSNAGERRNSETSIFSNHSVTLVSPPIITSQPILDEDDSSIYTTQLLDYFEKDNAEIPKFLFNPPPDYRPNDPIDDEGHTPLHWALSLANLPMIEVLMNICNANPIVPNNAGINCLSKMIFFNNSFELQNFPKILEMFKICLVTPDFNARIPLHHLIELMDKSEFNNINLKSLYYYLNEIFKFAENLPNQSNKSLLKILLNHQDINGDTVLHICARGGNKEILKLLLSKGADIEIRNQSGVSCKDLISVEVLLEFQKDNAVLQQQLLPMMPQQMPVPLPPQLPQQLPPRFSSTKIKKKDLIEDKENIFISENSNSLMTDYKVETEGTEPVITEKTLTTFQDKIPNLLTSLNESFVSQIDEKDEEYKHNLSIHLTLKENLNEITIQTNAKSSKLFNTTNLSITEINEKINSMEEELMFKQRNYLLFLEKSQSLQLAKLVQQQEQNLLTDSTQLSHTSQIDDVLKLSLKQCKRKNLISNLILKLVNFDQGKENFNNYKKLISKLCGLDDINDELLDDIEEALTVK